MAEQSSGAAAANGGQGSAAGAAPGNNAAPGGDSGRSDGGSFEQNPRATGHSPAIDQRQAAAGAPAGEGTIRFADGSTFRESDLRDAVAYKAESDSRKATLPPSPGHYRAELPPDFKAPEGMRFELNPADPLIARARDLAHARGVDQSTFSDMLGVYAASEISKQQHLMTARTAELSKLGSAGPQRIEAISRWLTGRVGAKADVLVNQIRTFPHAQLVGALEEIASQFSRQGGAQYQNGGRTVEETSSGRIPGYENMSFKEARVAQMAQQIARGGGGGRRGE